MRWKELDIYFRRAVLGIWCLLLLVLSVAALPASPAEEQAYTAVRQAVAAEVPARVISAARAFLQRFPSSTERTQVLFWLAEALYVTRAYREAAAIYQELVQETPTFPDAATAWQRLGLSHLYSRRYNAALTVFTQLLEQFPDLQEAKRIVFYMATSYFEQGRFDEALPLYQQLLQEGTAPVSAATLHVRLGDGYFYQQQFPRALQHYQVVLQEFPESTEALRARYQLGAVALAQQQFEAARQHFRTLLQTAERGPLAVQAHYALAWTSLHQGQVPQAVAYLRQQGLLQPAVTDAVLAQGYDLVLLQAYQEAIPLLLPVLESVQDEGQEQGLRWLLAQAYEGAGDLTQALQTLDDLIRRFPTSPRLAAAQRWRGDLLLRQRDASEALAAYHTAVQLTHDVEQTEQLLLTLGDLYQAQHATADAMATWQYLLRVAPLSPRRTEISLRFGAALVHQGAIAQAVALYHELLETQLERPAHLQTRLQLAWAYLKGGERDKALEFYGDLIRAVPGTDILRQARFWRGWLLQQQEQYEAANAEWQALLQLEPAGSRRGEVLWRLGSNLVTLKRYQEARTPLLQVVTTYAAEPYTRLAAWPLLRCLLELQQPREALQQVPGFAHQDPLGFFSATKTFARGERLMQEKQYQQARQMFQQVMAQPFTAALANEAEFMLGESYFVEGNVRQALRYYHAVTSEYGNANIAALARHREGMILQEAGQLPAAAYAFRQAVEQATNADLRGQALYRLGRAYVELQQGEEALAAFRRLMQDGQMGLATVAERLNLGLMLQQLGEYDLALQALRQALRHTNDERLRAEAHFWIAETQQLQGETAAALAAYQQVASRFPQQHPWALTALFRAGAIYEGQQQYQKAISMYQQVATSNPQDQQGRLAAERVKFLKAKLAAKASAPEG
jgi:TolA-binding protein